MAQALQAELAGVDGLACHMAKARGMLLSINSGAYSGLHHDVLQAWRGWP